MPPAIKFRIPKYSAVQNVDHFDLETHLLGFGSTREDFKIKVNGFPDYTNVVAAQSFKRIETATNIKYIHTNSGLVENVYINKPLNLLNIPNWSSTLNVNFGATGATVYDVTTAYLTASGVYAPSIIGQESTKPNFARVYLAEICHLNPDTAIQGSGATSWSSLNYLANTSVTMSKNPGPSGLYGRVSGTGVLSNFHDWYFAVTVSPLSVSSVPIISLSCIVEYL